MAKSGSSFLLAARRCEIRELEQLALTGELVRVVGRFIHALQKERGLSIVFLASRGTRFGDQRLRQVAECELLEQDLRTQFDTLDTASAGVRNGARLFSRIAVVLHAVDALQALRQRIGAQALPTEDASAPIVRLIAGLLGVVFEAADGATNPEISRALVAMFNFMQGKEFAGQERAFGAAAFASGHTDAAHQQQWIHLIASQERCFEVFTDFSGTGMLQAWRQHQVGESLLEIERLRRIGCALNAGGTPNTQRSSVWFDACTHRIDAMKILEDLLATDLGILCKRKISEARNDMRDQQALLDSLARQVNADSDAPARYGPQFERSMMDLMQEQARRLQAMGYELETVRAALNERKVVERAKGLLMASRKLTEDEAYNLLRQTAMNQNRRLLDVAEAVLAMSDFL